MRRILIALSDRTLLKQFLIYVTLFFVFHRISYELKGLYGN